MSLDSKLNALATAVGALFTATNNSLSTVNATLSNVVLRATSDNSTQNITTPVNFTNALTLNSSSVVTAGNTITMGNKSLNTPVLSGYRLSVLLVSTSTVLSAGNSCALVTTANAVTVTLPAATNGLRLVVKSTAGTVPAITVARAGTSLIDGATSVAITNANGWLEFISNGTNWFIIGKG